MKRNFEHIFHSVILVVILYFVMTLLLKQDPNKACSRSIVLGAVALIYMITFDHNFPPKGISSSLL